MPIYFVAIWMCYGCAQHIDNNTPKEYTAKYTAMALVVDGNLDETQWRQANWEDSFIDIEGLSKQEPFLQTKVKLLWDKHYLYLAAILEEPHLWATLLQKDAIIYRDNDFEIFIDPDGDGLNYYEIEINAFGTVLDLFLDKPYNQKGKADLLWDFEGVKTAVSLNGTLNNPSDMDTSWIVELAIPWTAFSSNQKSPPQNGDQWRMNFSRVQWTLDIQDGKYIKEEKPEYNWVWSPQGEINMHIPEKWGYLKFEGRPMTEFTGTPKFWIWSGADKGRSNSYWDSTFRELKEIGITGVLMSADSIVLKQVIPIATKLDMEVHAWFWTMNRRDANPEWWSVNQLGQSLAEEKAYVDYYKFMCPALPEVKGFIKSKMEGLVKIEGLKGIHMDYIRYVDAILPVGLWEKYGLVQDHIMPEFDYGYHPYMRNLFAKAYGSDPLKIENVTHDSLWLNFRLQELNKTVIGLRDYVNSTDLHISSAVFPTPQMSREMVRQDWDKWQLDYYFPMIYHNFYNEDIDWIRQTMAENKEVISPDSKIFCGLFLPALKDNHELSHAIQAAFEGGADGVAFFDLHALTHTQKMQIKDLSETFGNRH